MPIGKWVDEVIAEWAGSDNSPGSLTWAEWRKMTGKSREELRQLAPIVTAVDIQRETSEAIADAENVIWNVCDRLWCRAIAEDVAARQRQ